MKNYPITNCSLNLTQNCNLRCSYCFSYGHASRKMPIDIGKRAIDFLLKNARDADISDLNGGKRSVDIGFWGGEPLLEWKLLQDLVLYGESQKGGISMVFGGTTNGTLLTEEKFPFLDEHKVFFMVSLDGTQETHDRFRKFEGGLGSHARIMRNMEKVMKKWPFYKVRMSPYAENIHRFYRDVSYLADHGMYSIMFSPVYESNWTEEHWKIWEEQCRQVVDLIAEKKSKGIKIEIEHFKSYVSRDNSEWPCGAGRFYVGIDTDGAIFPCHRFNKFQREPIPWEVNPVCIGHIDYGVTRPDFRQKFIDFKPIECLNCEFDKTTPCHGGCYGVNFDFTGDITIAPDKLCRYVKMQKAVSEYYKEKVGVEIKNMPQGRGCTCYNLCYSEGTDDEIMDIDDSGIQCQCYNSNYTGEMNPALAKPIKDKKIIRPNQVISFLLRLDQRLAKIEEWIEKQNKVV